MVVAETAAGTATAEAEGSYGGGAPREIALYRLAIWAPVGGGGGGGGRGRGRALCRRCGASLSVTASSAAGNPNIDGSGGDWKDI